MLSEKSMEDAIAENPEKYLDEEGLTLLKRQPIFGKNRFDLLFEDRHGAKLIVEIQKGTLDRKHTYKIFDYYDEYKERHPKEFVELMVVANKIPRERRERLKSKGISFKEIKEADFPTKPQQIKHEQKSSDKSTFSNFKHHRNISDTWNRKALNDVNERLKKHINTLPIGKPIEVNTTARQSRDFGKIKPKGNTDGVRYLLWELHREGYIEFPDNKHYTVRKRIE